MGISSGAVQTKKSSYGMSALPVTNAIVYFNSRDTQPAVDQLRIPRRYQENRYRQTGIPCGRHNINLKGTYHFELSEKLPDLEELMRSIEGYLPVSEK
jgi:hypothetical protein